MEKVYDLVVIGAGPGGTPVAMESAKLDSKKSIALIDTLGELGGECLFQGCIPSKILEASAQHIKELEQLLDFGIELQEKHYNLVWEKIKQRKEEILRRRTAAAKEFAQSSGNIDILKGYASFVSPQSIELRKEDGSVSIIKFEKALIATGSKTFTPRYSGNAADAIMNNVEFFAKMELPKSLSIIGSGAIAIEFAQILSALGVEINLFIRGAKILKNIDSKASDIVLEKMRKDANIHLFFNANIESIEHKEELLEITYLQDGVSKSLLCQKVLSATGRIANIEGLHLQKAGVEYSKRGIITTEALQTSNKNIFANGDVVENFPKFAHTAQYAAHLIAQNLFLQHNFFQPDFSKNSWVLFSMPNIATAGRTEAEATSAGIETICDRFFFNSEAKSQIEEQESGYLEFVVQKSTQQIIGITIVHSEAHAIAGEAALIVAKKLTLKELIDTIHPHPTTSESFVMLAKQMMGAIMLEKLENPFVQFLLKLERLI